jgi:hypothetical protein
MGSVVARWAGLSASAGGELTEVWDKHKKWVPVPYFFDSSLRLPNQSYFPLHPFSLLQFLSTRIIVRIWLGHFGFCIEQPVAQFIVHPFHSLRELSCYIVLL